MGHTRAGGTSVDGAPWSTWASWAGEPVSMLYDYVRENRLQENKLGRGGNALKISTNWDQMSSYVARGI